MKTKQTEPHRRQRDALGLTIFLVLCALAQTLAAEDASSRYFEIRVIDAATNRGVPLVELTTVDSVTYVTDSAGRVAYDTYGHAGETIFFGVHAHGYRPPKDGFGIEGVRFKIEPGKQGEIALERVNIAERLYRVTGQDLYRDSLLLGHKTPLREPLGSGQVAGQDSVRAVPYRDKIFWFWGDTTRPSYPLGHFRMAGATSAPPGRGGLKPSDGIDYAYFVGLDGFSRPMADVADPQGVVWLGGMTTLPDEQARERLICDFSRRASLFDELEHGLMLYNDEREMFEVKTTLPLQDKWRFVRNHPTRVQDGGEEYVMCGDPFLTTRVKATLVAALDPNAYESWSCMAVDADPETAPPRRNEAGALDWRWQAGPPVTQAIEERWLKSGAIKPDEARYLPVDVERPEHRVAIHGGTFRWNAHRQRWVMIAVEMTDDKRSPSRFGEVWYSEADSPQGPWRKAARVVTHDKQTFYNPCHHAFFDEDSGRTIYFEGTYCNTFTENSPPTPRYNYNQVMYRMDLDHPALKKAFPRGK